MLQVNLKTFASDVLEDAMRLAQVKALNSFTFSDCLNYLNYTWSDIYSRMAMIDDGYYGINVRLTAKITKLPPYIKNSVQVYAAQSPTDPGRDIFRSAGTGDLGASSTYRISGTDLYCPDAERRVVWLYYVPMCAQLFFTMYNRDPKIFNYPSVTDTSAYSDADGIDRFELNDFYTYGEQNNTFNYNELHGYSLTKYENIALNKNDNYWYSWVINPATGEYEYTLLEPQPTGMIKKFTKLLENDDYTMYTNIYFTKQTAILLKAKGSWYNGTYPYTNAAYNKENKLWYNYTYETDHYEYELLDVQPLGGATSYEKEGEDGNYVLYSSVVFAALKRYSFSDYSACDYWEFYNRRTATFEDVTDYILSPIKGREDSDQWHLSFISCQYPYIFVTYTNNILNENVSGFFTKEWEFTEYNPFEFTGKTSNVLYLSCDWNDKTGLGVLVRDYNDIKKSTVENMNLEYVDYSAPTLKEMGWTPDTVVRYPIPEMYRYLVARLAEKFAAINESDVMGVQRELADARYAFEAFLDRDKSAWKRIENVNLPTIADYL